MSKQNEFKDTSLQYEDKWAEKYLLPEVQKVADASLRQFVKYFDSHSVDPFTGEQLVRPVRWGADLKIEHENHRIYITEWYIPTPDGNITDDVTGEILPGVHFREFVVGYHAAKNVARMAHQNGGPAKISLCYIPVLKHMGSAFLEPIGWLEVIREEARKRIKQAVSLIQGEIKKLEDQYGKRNEEGLYVGVRAFFNKENNEVEYVVQKHDAIHFIKEQNIEQNHIALKLLEHGYDQTPFESVKDPKHLNWSAVMTRMLDEKAGSWVRVSHPSKESLERLSSELVDYLLPQVVTLFDKTDEELLNVEGLVPGSIRHNYNTINSGLETHYKVVEKQKKIVAPAPENVDGEVPEFSGEEVEIDVVVAKQYDHGRDKALVLMLLGRIEPELSLPTQTKFEKAFNMKYLTTINQVTDELLKGIDADVWDGISQ